MTLKSAKPVKSAKKIKNIKLKLEINKDNKERAKSGKLEEKSEHNLDEDDFKKIKKKVNNTIVIGNKKINIKHLRKEIDDYKYIKEENSKILKSIDENIINQRQINLTKSFEDKNNNTISYKKRLNEDNNENSFFLR